MAAETGNGDLRDQVKKGLSEIRTTVLGVQILLGFQYSVLFQSGFPHLSTLRRSMELLAAGLLLTCIVLLLAPVAFHQITAKGQSTAAQERFAKRMLEISLLPFTLAIGAAVIVAIGEAFAPAAVAVGIAASLASAALWYGWGMLMAKPRAAPHQGVQPIPLKDRLDDLMTETRIVLPGVQALLGFQLIAYLNNGFAKLAPAAKTAHGVGLVLLLAAMILLMTSAPFHRLAEDGRDTERVCRFTARLILAALALLGAAFATDAYVVTSVITADASLALAAALAAAIASAILWFAWPLAARRWGAGSAPAPKSETAAGHA